MSSFVSGMLNAQREAAPEGTSKDQEAPGFGSYVDVVAALVPAEVLAANALLLTATTKTTAGSSVTTITESGTLEVIFWLSIAVSILLYFLGDRTRAKKSAQAAEEEAGPGQEVEVIPWGGWNYAKALIPAAAYVVWTMLEKSSAFDAIAPHMSGSLRMAIAVFAAISLGAIAKAFSDHADNKEPPAPTPAEPEPAAVPAAAAAAG